MTGDRIYLDNNATTRVFPEVAARIQVCSETAFANPGSQHSFGRDARRVLEDSREQIASILGADPSELLFTSGGTESINMSVHGFTFGRPGLIAGTAGEHPATLQSCERARQHGCELVDLCVDEQGLLQRSQLDTLRWDRLRLVCVILAHNETGVIQDVQELAERCRHYRIPLLLDAVQAVGKIDVNFHELGAAALAFGAHKFHGPRGVGGLLLRRDVRIPPFLEGGHQESGRRAGTEAVPLIAGMSTALQVWHEEHSGRTSVIQQMRDQLQRLLTERHPEAIVHGAGVKRLPNTLNVAFPGIPGEALLLNLHLQEVACSLGSTCASGSAEPAPALLAMGVPPDVCRSSVRFSLSIQNTLQEIQTAADRIQSVVHRLKDQTHDR